MHKDNIVCAFKSHKIQKFAQLCLKRYHISEPYSSTTYKHCLPTVSYVLLCYYFLGEIITFSARGKSAWKHSHSLEIRRWHLWIRGNINVLLKVLRKCSISISFYRVFTCLSSSSSLYLFIYLSWRFTRKVYLSQQDKTF